MNEKEVMRVLEECGAIVKGHFRLASEEDSDIYVNKDAAYLCTEKLSLLAEEIAKKFAKSGIGVVVGPATGGAILASWVAHHLTQISCREVFAVYADKDNGKFVIKRGYGKIVLIVEDIINTGTSVARTAEAVEKAGGRIVSIAALFNRGKTTSIGGIPIKSLVNKKLQSWEKGKCPLCEKGIPINREFGHPPAE